MEKIVINGIVKDGIVIPENGAELPEGICVEIIFAPPAITPELIAELEAWDRIGDEAWAMIDQWEQVELSEIPGLKLSAYSKMTLLSMK